MDGTLLLTALAAARRGDQPRTAALRSPERLAGQEDGLHFQSLVIQRPHVMFTRPVSFARAKLTSYLHTSARVTQRTFGPHFRLQCWLHTFLLTRPMDMP